MADGPDLLSPHQSKYPFVLMKLGAEPALRKPIGLDGTKRGRHPWTAMNTGFPNAHFRPMALPSPWVARFAPLIRRGGDVLDVACGGGRHLRHFRQLGHRTVGVDVDLRGVADLSGLSDVELVQADLEREEGGWPFPATRRFAGIVVTNYLHRPLFPALMAALEPGGVLIYETFAIGNARFGRPSAPAFLLRSGELLERLGGTLPVVAYEHGEVASPKAAVVQRICAVADSATAPDLDGDPEPRPLPP